jgi:hypothetical protein
MEVVTSVSALSHPVKSNISSLKSYGPNTLAITMHQRATQVKGTQNSRIILTCLFQCQRLK